MDINTNVNVNTQTTTPLRSEAEPRKQEQQVDRQQETQSVDRLSSQQPVQQAKEINEDIVKARVAEHQSLASGTKVTADQAVGSLVDVTV